MKKIIIIISILSLMLMCSCQWSHEIPAVIGDEHIIKSIEMVDSTMYGYKYRIEAESTFIRFQCIHRFKYCTNTRYCVGDTIRIQNCY